MIDPIQKPDYHWLLHPDSARAVTDYRQQLAEQGLSQAGAYLREQLSDQAPDSLSEAAFLEHLINTKRPLIFAESAVYGDGRDWSPTELSLLGDLGFAVPVRIFDDGRHHRPAVHPEPLSGTLLFIPGALLRNGRGCVPADWSAVTRDDQLDPVGYRALYERRLLPLLRYADRDAAERGQAALITVPGLGCGQFAGPFAGRLGEQLKQALIVVLERHAAQLPHVRLIYYDPYSECRNEQHAFGPLPLRVRPLLQGNVERPQLCAPSAYAEPGDDLSDCRLYSIVAWDPVSWPGNDYWGGARMTDDGVKAAASDLMRAITGVEGAYDTGASGYQPPEPYPTWEALVQDQDTQLQLVDRLQILG
ncbi:MAG: hypothetical protein K9L82_18435 [Chromatiaceae bacterium]|nr:hypothetical protein [Chromatiaceae bacterium]MCF8017178.1 hypothetical protein [Chromatiaceae bacterium]